MCLSSLSSRYVRLASTGVLNGFMIFLIATLVAVSWSLAELRGGVASPRRRRRACARGRTRRARRRLRGASACAIARDPRQRALTHPDRLKVDVAGRDLCGCARVSGRAPGRRGRRGPALMADAPRRRCRRWRA
jgi:hypothetical protein